MLVIRASSSSKSVKYRYSAPFNDKELTPATQIDIYWLERTRVADFPAV